MDPMGFQLRAIFDRSCHSDDTVDGPNPGDRLINNGKNPPNPGPNLPACCCENPVLGFSGFKDCLKDPTWKTSCC